MTRNAKVAQLRRVARGAAVLVLAVVTGAALPALSPTPAQAATGCWGAGPTINRSSVERWNTQSVSVRETYRTRYCYAYRSGQLYQRGPSGWLFAGTSWFVCQRKWPGYPNPAVGNARNDWWLFTLADYAYSGRTGWGWFPATLVSGGYNWGPIPNLPSCDTTPGTFVTAWEPTYYSY